MPGPVIETDDHIQFKLADGGDILITLTKAHPGEHFEDLDMLSKLILQPSDNKKTARGRACIQEVGEECQVEDDPSQYDWFAPTEDTLDSDDDDDGNGEDTPSLVAVTYGFAGSKSGLFRGKVSPVIAIGGVTALIKDREVLDGSYIPLNDVYASQC